MKTPREILLERHRAADKRLDALRRRVVSDLNGTNPGVTTGLLVRVWSELFWSCRRVWCGLAAVWLVILLIDLGAAQTAPTHAARQPAPSPGALLAWQQEQQRLLSDRPIVLAPAATPVQPVPRPRSDLHPRTVAV